MEHGYHRFEENFKVKGSSKSDHQVCVHHPHDRISAMKGRSSTIFEPSSHGTISTVGRLGSRTIKVYSGVRIYLACCDVSDVIFRCKGTLKLNWVLEGV